MKKLPIDDDYLLRTLLSLLAIPSPTGYTSEAVQFVGKELKRLGVAFELTRRGAICATLRGRESIPARAIVSHLDTLGALVRMPQSNGRLSLSPVGTWSARFAEGARVTVLTPGGSHRGTILPLKASGHIFHEQVDTQPSGWDHIELRLDARCRSADDVWELGIRIGDYVVIDSRPEVERGFINARHLDDKAGVAAVLAAVKAVTEAKLTLPVQTQPIFTISEEVGSGAAAAIHADIAELVAVDNATPGPGQAADEFSATIAMADMTGPFDYHLTQKLLNLCDEFNVPYQRDLMRHYRCDAASAIEAGHDIRTALVAFGVDASHGHERTHIDALRHVAELLTLYMQSEVTFERDRRETGPLEGFPSQPGPEPGHEDQARWSGGAVER